MKKLYGAAAKSHAKATAHAAHKSTSHVKHVVTIHVKAHPAKPWKKK